MSTYESSITNPKKQLEFYKDLSEQLEKENQELKKQLEDAKNNYEKEKYIVDKQTRQLTDEYKNTKHQTNKVEELKNQQKEFIEYMNKTIEDCNNYSKYIEKKTKELHGRSCGKTYIANEIMKNEVAKKILKEILSKYKEIIGDDK